MGDTTRPDDETFQKYYDVGYRTWRHRCLEAAASRERPADTVDFADVTSIHHPYIHQGLELKPGDDGNLHATGTAMWDTTRPGKSSDLPPIEQPYSIPVTTRQPIPLALSGSPEQFPTWFGARGNHIAILTLAWACALSMHWAGRMPGGDPRSHVLYTETRAPWRQPGAADEDGRNDDDIVVDLGPAPLHAICWWAAVLAPGRGWIARIPHGDEFYQAPWTTHLDSSARRFVLTGVFPRPQGFPPPVFLPPFPNATIYISWYAAYHGVQSQSRAALAAALMLPTAARMMGTVTLPAPRLLPVDNQRYYMHMTQPEHLPPWGPDVIGQGSKLLTLSCAKTLPSVMKSIFFHEFVYCNEYGAWLQGTLAALDQPDVKSNLEVLTAALMADNPRVAFLWLGAALLNVHARIIDDLRGPNPSLDVDLTVSGWLGTTSSFIQLPVLEPRPNPDTITRSNEARLLFMTQTKNYTQAPANVPCEPFGNSAIADCPPEVREHLHCGRWHMLWFSGWTWDCSGPSPHEGRHEASLGRLRKFSPKNVDYESIEVDYSCLDRGQGDASRELTRRVFAWLRGPGGFPERERELSEHEWFRDMEQLNLDGEKGSVEGEDSAGASQQPDE